MEFVMAVIPIMRPRPKNSPDVAPPVTKAAAAIGSASGTTGAGSPVSPGRNGVMDRVTTR